MSSSSSIYCIWSSMVENAALSRSAFLISSAVTYGYSPYSRKLGTLVVADELDECLRVLLPILREAFEIGENCGDAGLAEQLRPRPRCTCRSRCRRCPGTESAGPSRRRTAPTAGSADAAAPTHLGCPRSSPRSSCRTPGRLLAALLDLRDDGEPIAGRRPRDRSVRTVRARARSSPLSGWPSPRVWSSLDQSFPAPLATSDVMANVTPSPAL